MKKYLIWKYSVRLQKFENFSAISISHLKANKKNEEEKKDREKSIYLTSELKLCNLFCILIVLDVIYTPSSRIIIESVFPMMIS